MVGGALILIVMGLASGTFFGVAMPRLTTKAVRFSARAAGRTDPTPWETNNPYLRLFLRALTVACLILACVGVAQLLLAALG